MDSIRRHPHQESFVSGIIRNNPLFVMVLGTCPALAITTSLEAALGMGLLFLFVLVGSNVLISLLREIIPDEIKTPSYIVIIATFVTIVKMFCNAYLPALYNSLGVFLSLLVVNCIVLGRAEAFASENGVFDSFLDGLGNGLGYTLALGLIALLREILGTGYLTFGEIFAFLPYMRLPILKALDGSYDYSMSLFTSPMGGFVVFGLLMALLQTKNLRKKDAARAAAIAEAQLTAQEGA
jgi:electron transport complex protein RnfE